jgi:hypothetical protein
MSEKLSSNDEKAHKKRKQMLILDPPFARLDATIIAAHEEIAPPTRIHQWVSEPLIAQKEHCCIDKRTRRPPTWEKAMPPHSMQMADDLLIAMGPV